MRRIIAVLTVGVVGLLLPGASWAGPVDSDGDGVPDTIDVCVNEPDPGQANDDNDSWGNECDNCTQVTNQDQCDFDNDGYGNFCDGDTTNDNIVGIPDFADYKTDFGTTGHGNCGTDTDYNNDGVVGIPDFGLFKVQFTQGFPGPSGVDCADGAAAGTCPPESP